MALKNKPLPIRNLLLDLFEYDEKTGKLFWKDHWCKMVRTRFVGKEAGKITNNGYRHVSIFDEMFLVHRIIWFMKIGDEPPILDHIDGDPLNNRLSNLRPVTQRQNSQNYHTHRKGKLPGCHFVKSKKLWGAQITTGNKKKHLGQFRTEQEAHNAYVEAVSRL